MSFEAHLLAERSVPRYTSYPTAPHFSPQVNAATYTKWLAALPRAATLSLYLHVPFCRALCLYCGCHTKAVKQQAPVDDYAGDLVREVALVGEVLGTRPVSHIHWGGGTPSILGPDRLRALADALSGAFDLGGVREHAIELDPRYVDRALVEALVAIGVNRVSLGVQDLSPHVQQTIGRIQPLDTVRRAVERVREAGVAAINFDLMYGLPRQGLDDVRATAEQAVALAPQRIALFGYAHVPWFRRQQRLFRTEDLPGSAERLAQAEAARAVFLGGGYQPIGFDHFAQPHDTLAVAARSGRLHRNFQGYTDDDAGALIGIGASAIGRLPQGYAQNAPDVGGYARAVRAGRFATVRGIALSSEDRRRSAIIERIMCDLAVDLSALAPQVDHAAELQALAPLAGEGLVQLAGSTIRITERGRPFVRLVAAAFDAYLQDGGQRHSQAV